MDLLLNIPDDKLEETINHLKQLPYLQVKESSSYVTPQWQIEEIKNRVEEGSEHYYSLDEIVNSRMFILKK